MKKMTRFLALGTMLVLMLSMSVTAFAVSPHSTAAGTCQSVSFTGRFDCFHDDGSQNQLQVGDVIKRNTDFYPFGCNIYVDGEKLTSITAYPWDARVTSVDGTTLRCELIMPPSQPQPKTGVMDTLPVWFGVMAVSACAYVLTSKKKVF